MNSPARAKATISQPRWLTRNSMIARSMRLMTITAVISPRRVIIPDRIGWGA